ncbi:MULTISPECIES: slipin family protein [Rhodomicrobium]|uniref:slipin family protein n=1 Tax=Rhodomicrobium TaxID=1068 RepID=UPI000B4AB0AB|nr:MULTISPECIES: slipin family protein [Rhodomicrobium]
MTVQRNWFSFEVILKDDERAFLTREGRFVKLVGPGKYSAFDPGHELAAEIVKVVRAEIPAERALMLAKAHPEFAAEHFEIVQAGPTQVALVSFDGDPKHLVLPNTTRAFWKTLTKVEVERIETAEDFRVARQHLNKVDAARAGVIVQAVVEAHEAALLIVDGELKERLGPGRHAFWAVGRAVRLPKIDLRPQPLEVTAQEILTKDRVAIRVTLTAFYKVTDPVLAATSTGDLGNTLYRLVQFAIREAVATRTLDDILAARDAIDREVREFVTERVRVLGAEVGEIGVKDVILPGDIRELLNKVVEAERVAKANLIRRQEETAATRSLLNTAKLMENNPLLLRLKELEALEKLVEKVGRIDLHTGNQGGGFEALLSKLYTIEAETLPPKVNG